MSKGPWNRIWEPYYPVSWATPATALTSQEAGPIAVSNVHACSRQQQAPCHCLHWASHTLKVALCHQTLLTHCPRTNSATMRARELFACLDFCKLKPTLPRMLNSNVVFAWCHSSHPICFLFACCVLKLFRGMESVSNAEHGSGAAWKSLYVFFTVYIFVRNAMSNGHFLKYTSKQESMVCKGVPVTMRGMRYSSMTAQLVVFMRC